jgi:hypothetical protein
MAKLKMGNGGPAAAPANAVPAVPGSDGQTIVAEEAGVAQPPPPPPSNPTGNGGTPFKVEVPGQASGGGTGNRPNLVQRRQEKIKEATEGHSFTFNRLENGQEFTCICGAVGKNAIVLNREDGVEVKVGSNCLKQMKDAAGTQVTVPRQPREARADGASSPGISRQQKLQEALKKFTAPFRFVRKQEGSFKCLCGGQGTNQIIVADANGAEFAVGNTCAGLIPGVEIPKAQRQSANAAPTVAGLKGKAEPPPDFSNIG